MAVEMDLNGMTAGEMAELGAALGCTTFRQVQAKMTAAQAMAADGDLPLDMLVPMMWLSRKAVDPAFTLEQARTMPLVDLVALGGATQSPNADGGQAAESSATSSGRSARSTTTRRGSSGSLK